MPVTTHDDREQQSKWEIPDKAYAEQTSALANTTFDAGCVLDIYFPHLRASYNYLGLAAAKIMPLLIQIDILKINDKQKKAVGIAKEEIMTSMRDFLERIRKEADAIREGSIINWIKSFFNN